MLDSLAGSMLDAEGLEERQRRKEAWKARGGKVQCMQKVPSAHAMNLPIAGPSMMEWRFNITLPHSPAGATGGHGRAAGGAFTWKFTRLAYLFLATSLRLLFET